MSSSNAPLRARFNEAAGTNDGACYQQTPVRDPLAHQSATLTDAWGRAVYAQRFTGNSPSTYALYATTRSTYDLNGKLVALLYPNGTSTSSSTYDAAGRLTATSDPDRGAERSVYDANGNLTQHTDARGASGTVFTGYDGLNRPIWRNTTNSPTGAYVTHAYDSTAGGNVGIGRLTGQTFAEAPSNGLSGAYAYVYDVRGQTVEADQTVAGTRYATTQTFNDAGAPLATTYPDGLVATLDYDASGIAKDLQATLPAGGGTSYIVASASYAPAGQLSSLGIAGTPTTPLFTSQFSYDSDQRLTESQATLTGAGAPFYDLTLGYDAASNVTGLTTTLPTAGSTPGGTDSQAFCYDEFARLVWAGTTGTPSGPAAGSCGPAPSGTTLSGAGYTASYAYDVLDRLTTGPAGSYTYGDSTHLDAVTSTTNGHAYAYDAAGDATCRAPSGATACSGSNPTGAVLSYDAEGRLAGWQNAPSGPTTDSFLYDGSGARVEQQTATNGTASTTSVYIGALAEYDTSGGTTTPTDYLSFAGKLVATHDTAWHYLLSDQLGTPQVQVGASGTPEALQVKTPYGRTRYAAASLASLGFTGQRKDSTPNLTYFQARYYDQEVGAFLSADSVAAGGLNRYAYVQGNPETHVDRDGHCWPLCALVAAAVTFVAVTIGDSIVQASQNGWNFSKVDYGSAARMGAVAGVVVGATLLLGPAAEAATAAIAGAVSSGAAALGASAAAGEVAGTVVASGIMGAGEGAIQGYLAGDRGLNLAEDVGFGAVSGGLGGAAGSLASRLAREAGLVGDARQAVLAARVGGVVSAGTSNIVTQGVQMARGQQNGPDGLSFGVSLATGYGWSYLATGDPETMSSFARHPFVTAGAAATGDLIAQSVGVPWVHTQTGGMVDTNGADYVVYDHHLLI